MFACLQLKFLRRQKFDKKFDFEIRREHQKIKYEFHMRLFHGQGRL